MQHKPLIALLTNNDDDVYCFRLELLRALLDNSYSLLVSCPDGPKFEVMEEIGFRKDKDFIYDNPPIDRRGTNIKNDWILLRHYFRLFKKYNPSIILTYTAKPNVYASMVAHYLGVPVINNVTGLGSVLKETGIKRKLIMMLFKMAYRGSACIMFQNATNMKLAKELGWVKNDYKLIPGSGVDLLRFPVQEYPEGGDGVNGERVVFNYIGRILHDKGVDDYIEAAKIIHEEYPNTEFNMVGFIEPSEQHYEYELQELEKDCVVFYRGSQKDIHPWIKRSHAIIHPSTYGEGMSNVLLENAASGRPIITTDNPGCRETLDDTISGFIYHGGDVDELIEKIECFLRMDNESRQKMGLNGRDKVEREFSRELVIKAYLDAIEALLRKQTSLS